MGRKRMNNKGFSLVELIVGVLILGLIVGPLLHSMVTSANTANKSRSYRSATLTAQNLAEQVKADGISGLLYTTKTNSDYTLYRKSDSGDYERLERNAAGDYCYTDALRNEVTITNQEDSYYVEVRGIEDGRRTYDGLLTLTAGAPTNKEEIALYTAMDAVFVQPPSREENPDFEAARAMAAEAQLLTMALDETGVGKEVKVTDFVRSMERKITIDVEDIPGEDGHGGYVTASVTLEYTGTYGGTDDELRAMLGDWPFRFPANEKPVKSEFFKKYYGTDSWEAFRSLYFFYYPSYAGDTIILNNNIPDKSQPDSRKSIPFTLFLIKQNVIKQIDGHAVDDYGYGNNVQAEDALYTRDMEFQVWENYDIMNMEPLVQVLTNIPVNIVSGEPTPLNTLTYKVFKGLWYSTKSSAGSLVRTEDENRLYSVNVQLFKEGTPLADMTEGNSIVTMNASLIQ